MSYTAIVVKLHNVREHSNADKLQLATVCGNQVIVGLDSKEGDMGVYFDVDGQLTPEFLKTMSLYRKGEMNKDKDKTGMFDENGRVRAQNFRGEKSEGFWVPLKTVQKAFKYDVSTVLNEGAEFDTIGKELICKKYINPHTLRRQGTQKSSKKIENEMFHQHFDTAQFGRNSFLFQDRDLIYVTEKVHGTSQRVTNCKIPQTSKWYHKLFNVEPKAVWKDMIGTRRVILDDAKLKDDSGWHSSEFRVAASSDFLGNLKKGETVYYEVVGYEPDGKAIMGSHSNEKMKGHLDKDAYKKFIATYGKDTVFSYGCSEKQHAIYVYRITLTNEEGYSIDLSWEAVKARCSELGVNHVTELFVGTKEEMVTKQANREKMTSKRLVDGLDNDVRNRLFVDYVKFLSEGKTSVGHNLMEGICLRVEKGITPLVLKEKNFEFKCLEGIIKDNSDYVDAEESQEELIEA